MTCMGAAGGAASQLCVVGTVQEVQTGSAHVVMLLCQQLRAHSSCGLLSALVCDVCKHSVCLGVSC
jgi:hypothetical protein